MADVEACRAALMSLSERLVRGSGTLPERTVSCTVTDLGMTFHTLLGPAGFGPLSTDAHEPAQVRITTTSDDLVALVDGRLQAMSAYATGRLGIKASFGDLMLLRSLG